MKFNIRAKKIELTDSIKNYCEEKLSKLDKYLDNPSEYTANVVLRVDGFNQTVEVTVPIKSLILRAEVTSSDLYTSIDLVIDKLERQIRKSKTRLNKSVKTSFIEFEIIEEEVEEGKIVKRKEVDSKPMSEEEAILQMELLGHDFFIFNNSENNTNSLLYKRKDGNYGIIEIK